MEHLYSSPPDETEEVSNYLDMLAKAALSAAGGGDADKSAESDSDWGQIHSPLVRNASGTRIRQGDLAAHGFMRGSVCTSPPIPLTNLQAVVPSTP